jgi:hypothetical protein
MKMNRYALVLAMCAIITGCAQKPTPPQPEPTQVVAPEPLPQEAQSVLDQLNAKCASEPWRNEIDIIERPETRPDNRVISGEVSSFVSDCKERLAKHSVQVKWNAQKKLYEVEKTQQSPGE